MKTSYLLRILKISIVAAVAAIPANGFIPSLHADETKSPEALVSAEKNSFKEVTSKLDAGGDFYFYWGTEQLLRGISTKIASARGFLTTLPDLKEKDREEIEKAIQVVERLVRNSGIEEVSGLGMSSIATEKEFFRSKFILHHYKGSGSGFLWSLFGKTPHDLNGFDLLPSNTALASFSDLDLALVWTIVQSEVSKLGNPEATKQMEQFPSMFEAQAGMKFDEMLCSLGGEYGILLTLDEAKRVPIPVGKQAVQIPEPALLIAIKVKDDLIYDRFVTLSKGNEQVVLTEKDGLRMLTMPVPLPVPIQLRPSLARFGDYLLFASSDALIQEVVAVKSGTKPGLKSTDTYKKLAQGLPARGNNFFFVNQSLGKVVADIQRQSLKQTKGATPAQAAWIQQLIGTNSPPYMLSVSANTDEGWMTIGNGSQSANRAVMLPLIAAPVGLLAAIAIPNFVKARETAQRNACITNLRQIDGAKEQWALENKKYEGDLPTDDDLFGTNGFIARKPACPSGGSYSINPVGTNPTCSHPRHSLP